MRERGVRNIGEDTINQERGRDRNRDESVSSSMHAVKRENEGGYR